MRLLSAYLPALVILAWAAVVAVDGVTQATQAVFLLVLSVSVFLHVWRASR